MTQIHWIWQQKNWPQFTWQQSELTQLLREINQSQGKLLGHSAVVSGNEGVQSQLDALLQNAINTSAIEGEDLNVDSVRTSLARQLGLDQSGLPPGTPQTDGLADVLLDATRNPDEPLSLSRLFHWHEALFPEGGDAFTTMHVGQLRGDDPMQVVSGPHGRSKVHFEAPPRAELEAELDQFIGWFNQSQHQTDVDPLIRAGIAHLWLVTLHPLDDGNGRVARANTDLALAQAERQSVQFYAMSATIMLNREAYYSILEQTQRGDLNITTWLV